MKRELATLTCMVMVLCLRRLAEAEETHLLANPQCKHHRLQSGGVMEHGAPVRIAPFVQMLPGGLHKNLERIILHYSATEVVESGIGDKQGGLVGRVAEVDILELDWLADVYHNWDVFPV